MKRCNDCKQEKPLSEFNRNRKKADGLQSECRECQKARFDEWYDRKRSERGSLVVIQCPPRSLGCGSYRVRLREVYTGRVVEWEQDERGDIERIGETEPGKPYKVDAICLNCGHEWQPQRAREIIKIGNEYFVNAYTKGRVEPGSVNARRRSHGVDL